MVLSNQVDDLRSRSRKVNVPDIKRMSQFWEVAQNASYVRTVRAKVRQTVAIWEILFEHEQNITSQDSNSLKRDACNDRFLALLKKMIPHRNFKLNQRAKAYLEFAGKEGKGVTDIFAMPSISRTIGGAWFLPSLRRDGSEGASTSRGTICSR